MERPGLLMAKNRNNYSSEASSRGEDISINEAVVAYGRAWRTIIAHSIS
jgi:hypothetical protein